MIKFGRNKKLRGNISNLEPEDKCVHKSERELLEMTPLPIWEKFRKSILIIRLELTFVGYLYQVKLKIVNKHWPHIGITGGHDMTHMHSTEAGHWSVRITQY